MKLPFVSRRKYETLLYEKSRLDTRLTRQELFEMNIPLLPTLGPSDSGVYSHGDAIDQVAIIGSGENIEKIRKIFNSKTTHEREIVQLILDLHNKTWSLDSDKFLRILNISPEKYWKKYMTKKGAAK